MTVSTIVQEIFFGGGGGGEVGQFSGACIFLSP